MQEKKTEFKKKVTWTQVGEGFIIGLLPSHFFCYVTQRPLVDTLSTNWHCVACYFGTSRSIPLRLLQCEKTRKVVWQTSVYWVGPSPTWGSRLSHDEWSPLCCGVSVCNPLTHQFVFPKHGNEKNTSIWTEIELHKVNPSGILSVQCLDVSCRYQFVCRYFMLSQQKSMAKNSWNKWATHRVAKLWAYKCWGLQTPEDCSWI